MEDTKKSRNDQEGGNKKMVIKMAKEDGIKMGGGGGIGAVVLLGGALATAAFASAFVLGQKKKDRRQKSEKDEAKKGQEIIPRDQLFYEPEHIRKEEKEEVGVEKDSTIKISEDGFVIVKEEIPILAEEEKVESIIKEENSDHQSKEKSAERESDDGEIDTKDGGDIEVIRADINDVKGEENVNTEEKNEIGEFCNGNGEINEEKCVEEPEASETVFSEKTLLTTDDSVQIAVKSEEDKVEEKTAIIHLTMLSVVSEEVRENAQVINHVEEDKTSMEIDAKQNVEEDQISPEEVEVVKYVANENLELQPDSEPEENKDELKRESEEEEEELIVHEMSNMVNGEVSRNEESSEVIETKSLVHTRAKTNRMKIMMDHGGDLNESEENSKWEGEWPKVSSKETKEGKGMSYDYEVGGKIQEDYSATKGTFTNKDEVMTSNPTRWRVMIWTLSVLSSLSCSWFFDLSPAKLCLVLFLTVFLLEIYDYPLLNRRQAQCLHAAKGERIYEQRSLKKKK